MIDGFDIVVASFTATSVRSEFALSYGQTGVFLSSGLFGMMAGAIALAPLADSSGRRPAILIGLLIAMMGMAISAYSPNFMTLLASRLICGLGIGILFASLTSMVAEYSSEKMRNLFITLLYVGYPIGATVGGLLSVSLIENYGWRSAFFAGFLTTAVMVFLAYFKLPESEEFLAGKSSAAKRAKSDGKGSVAGLPRQLFARSYLFSTLSLWVCFFSALLTVYFLISWTPAMLVEFGFRESQSIYAGTILNVGGGFGMVVLGLITTRYSLFKVIPSYFLLGFASMVVFSLSGSLLHEPFVFSIIFLTGFFTYGALIGLYALGAAVYAPAVRATGIGWSIGIGRLGSVVGPLIAGFLMSYGWGKEVFFPLLGAPLIVGALVIYVMGTRVPGKAHFTAR